MAKKGRKITQRKPSRKLQNELKQIEVEKLSNIFNDISADKKELAQSLIEEAAFMKITLDILKVRIQLDGPTYEFKQGKQEMIIENPAQKSYNTMINRYNAICNSLLNLLPNDTTKTDEVDKLAELLARRGS